MKYGHKLTLKIDSLDDLGRGRAAFDIVPGEQRSAAVAFTAPGDEVIATFTKRDHDVKVCKLDKILKSGPDRVVAPCPHAGTCGGCLWQHLDYKAQLAEKQSGIKSLFAKLDLNPKVADIFQAEKTFGYRNRMDFAIGWNGEIGLKEYGSWNHYVDVKECLLVDPGIGKILQAVRDWMKKFDLQPWDAKFHSGDIRYVVIRDGKNTNQRLIVIVVSDTTRLTPDIRTNLINQLHDAGRGTCDVGRMSVLIGHQPKPTDISLSESFEILEGREYFEESVNNVTYRIHPNSFFQTNTDMAGRLQLYVLEQLKNLQTKKLLDLYCGLGFFGIAAAKLLPELNSVHGYELDEQAIQLASQNADLNKVGDKCNFFSGKAEDLSWQEIPADTIIIDPPRSGLHPKVIKTLIAKQPDSIIYISCNYHRLEHELPYFLYSYEVQSIQPFDLFPQTRHVEVVCVLTKRFKTT